MSDEVLFVGFWAMSDGGKTPITYSQVVTISPGPKAYQQYLTLRRAALIHGQPFEETSFMVGKYITKLPWHKVFHTTSGNAYG